MVYGVGVSTLERPPSLAEVQAERCRRSLRAYTHRAWRFVEPGPMEWNWHLDAICEHLEAAVAGEIRRLIITVGPRHMKSLATSVFMPSWVWTRDPSRRFLFASYGERLALRDAGKARRLIESTWYHHLFGDVFSLRYDQRAKGRYENDKGGVRISASVGGLATGEGGDILVLDDPIKIEEADSDAVREDTLEWVDQVWLSRANDPEDSVFICIQQRTHEEDVAGHFLDQGGWEVLCLPEEYEPTHPFAWPDDPRTEPGELLWPDRFTEKWMVSTKLHTGSDGWAKLYQQRPSPAEGGIFKEDWWGYWRPNPKAHDCDNCEGAGWLDVKDHGLVKCNRCNGFGMLGFYPAVDQLLLSWDMTFKDTAGSDLVCGGVWGRKGANVYLFDITWDRMDFVESRQAFVAQCAAWPGAVTKLVEDKANGPAVIASLKQVVQGLIAVNPEGGKVARANAVAPVVEAGNVFLPHPDIAPWVDRFVHEHKVFPNGAHDDAVDMTTQALLRLKPTVVGVGPEVW